MTKKIIDNLIDKLDETGMLYFVIVSLFSVDNLVDVESCEGALKIIRELKEDLPLSKLKDDNKLKARLDDAERIIMRDLEAWTSRKRCS